MRRAALTTALLAGACALPIGSAQAATVTSATYDAQFEGVYHYNATESYDGVMDATRVTDLGFNSSTAAPLNLSRAATTDTLVAETGAPVASLDGAYHEVTYGDPVVHQDCTLALDGAPPAGIFGAATGDDGTITVDVRPFDRVDGLYTCSRPITDPHLSLSGGDFDVRVTVPAVQLGDATIVVPVESPASLPCPGYAFTTSCDASWTGRVTLTLRSVTNAPEPRPATPAPGGRREARCAAVRPDGGHRAPAARPGRRDEGPAVPLAARRDPLGRAARRPGVRRHLPRRLHRHRDAGSHPTARTRARRRRGPGSRPSGSPCPSPPGSAGSGSGWPGTRRAR